MAPLHINAPLYGAYRSRNRDKKYSKLKKRLHFVELQDLRAGRLPSLYYGIVSRMLFFRNTALLLFLSRVRIAQPYSDQVITNAIAVANTILDLPLGYAKLVCFCYKYIGHGRSTADQATLLTPDIEDSFSAEKAGTLCGITACNTVWQGYSNGGPRSESGPLDVEVRTSSASQSCILYAEVFIPKSSAFTSASEPLTRR